MTTKVWLNGQVLDESAARISPFDHGITVGDGVFETLKLVGTTPFAMRRHLLRLERSATALGIECPPAPVIHEAAAAVIDANGMNGGRLRITLTGGPGPLGSNRGAEGTTLLLAVADTASYPPSTDVCTVEWPRNERGALTGLKTTSYAENVMALARATALGASEAIFANTVGNLCEGTGSNIFVAVGGRLITPPLAAGPLAGITRELVLEITEAIEEDLPMHALHEVDEAFLTSSTRDVQAIRAIDGIELRSTPGPFTQTAAQAFAALTAADLDP